VVSPPLGLLCWCVMFTNSLVSLKESSPGCQVSSSDGLVFECQAPSRESYSGKLAYPCAVRKKYAGGEVRSVFLDGRVVSSLVPYDGSLCRGCQWAVFVPDVSPLLVIHGVQSATFEEIFSRKRRRFYVRSFRGAMCGIGKGYRFRWFVLTESDAALESRIDFGVEFHRFTTWLRKVHCQDFQYEVVEHRQGIVSKVTKQRRRNWHILSYGSDRLPVKDIREYWLSHFKSTVTGMAEVREIDKAIYYLSKYLSGNESFIRSWTSHGWVYRGWIGDSRKFKGRFGEYPDEEIIRKLSLMSPGEREYARLCLEETGYLSLSECV